MKPHALSASNKKIDKTEQIESATQMEPMRKMVYLRTQQLAKTLNELARSIVTSTLAIKLVQLLTKFYTKLLIPYFRDLTKIYRVLKLKPTKKFSEMLQHVARLTSSIYILLVSLQDKEKRDSKHKETKGQMRKEAKIIPYLVGEIEKFESSTIAFSTLTEMALYNSFKRSTARDFRIDPKLLVAVQPKSEKKGKKRKSDAKSEKSRPKKKKQKT